MNKTQPPTTTSDVAPGPASGRKTATGVFDTWCGANLLERHTFTTELRWGVRYSQSDPLGLSGGLNLFEYAQSNPNRFVDPDGRMNFPWRFYSWYTNCASSYRWDAEDVAGDVSTMPWFPGGPDGINDGPADAFRHCYWSCQVTMNCPRGSAFATGWGHELDNIWNDGQPGDRTEMDSHNNRVGRRIGSQCPVSCYSNCVGAVFSGELTWLTP